MTSGKLLNFQETFTIGDNIIGNNEPCFIIAEAGLSHLGETSNISKLIDMAKMAGVNAIKTQHFHIDELVSKEYDHEWYKRIGEKELKDSDIIEFATQAKKAGLEFICTPHHESILDFLIENKLINCIKIGSGEIGNKHFLAKCARTNLPILLSTGLLPESKLNDTLKLLWNEGCRKLAILHCVTSYPTKSQDANLVRIKRFKDAFSGPVGYSDHTIGNAIPLASIVVGACILEKHITLKRDIPNAQDWKVSCDREELIELVKDVRSIEDSMKDTDIYQNNPNVRWATKSLYASRNIKAGEKISIDNVVAKRPNIGICVSEQESIIGLCTKKDIQKGKLIQKDELHQ